VATDHGTDEGHATRTETTTGLHSGAVLMALGALGFVAYGVVFLALAFVGDGFELGVSTLDGLGRAELADGFPEIAFYITHLHVATAAFITATGIAAASLSWYGVRSGQLWAWATAVVAPVVGLAGAIPMHYADGFHYHGLTHLGPIYLSTLVFVVGAVLALRGLRGSQAGEP